MKLSKVLASATAAVTLAAGGILTTAAPAHAASWTTETLKLCQPDCSIDISVSTSMSGVTEGVPFNVNVVGKGGATVKVAAFIWDVAGWKKVTPDYTVTLPASGTGTTSKVVSMTVAPLVAPYTAISKVYLQPADVTAAHLEEGYYVSGSNSTGAPAEINVRSSRGGDAGWQGSLTNGVFHRAVENGIPGQVYGVQMYVGGSWRDVTNYVGTVGQYGTAAIQGKVPAGLAAGRYYVRIYNKTKGIYDLTPVNSYYIDLKAFDVYTQEGYWDYNGRKWHTTCEAYGQTRRCRTDIWASMVIYDGARYVQKTDYHFNNLTYLPLLTRQQWSSNPLGYTGTWTVSGRKWRTECDTATTGRNNCRSYIWGQAISAVKNSNGTYTYSRKWTWLFNNMVRFKV